MTASKWCARLAALSMSLGLACEGPVRAERLVLPEYVEFPSLDHWQGSTPLLLTGYFYKTHKTIAPAVLLLHGCAGAISGKTGQLTSRFTQMAALLNDMGYSVLVADSFNPRGQREICTTPIEQRSIRNRHRLMDAYGALRYLNSRSDVVHGKVAAMGFSHGGSGALSVMDATTEVYSESGEGFAAAVALYPGCRWQYEKRPEFQAYGPLLVLAGELDDWTPVEPCKKLVRRSQQRGEPVELEVYPDAHHGFDQTTPVRRRMDVTHGVNRSAGVHVGGNPQARKAAYERIQVFLKRHLQP